MTVTVGTGPLLLDRLYVSNCFNVMPRITPGSVRLFIADPPYEVSRPNNFHTMGRTGIDFDWDKHFDQVGWLPAMAEALMPSGNVVIWNDWKKLGLVAEALTALDFDVKRKLTWIKCLDGGTRVYARTQRGDGPARLKDLVRRRPSTVRLWTGQRWSRVVSWERQPEPEAPIEVEFRSGETVRCTSSHRWPTRRGLLLASDLLVGDIVETTRLPEPEAPARPQALSDEDVGWFVGLYIAEGSRGGHKSAPKVQIAGNVDEHERHSRLRRIAEAFHGTCAVHRTRGRSVAAHLTGVVVNAVVDEYVAGHDCYDKHLKPKAWRRSDAFLEAVLRGYLDGDGHFDARNDRFRLGFTGRNRQLAWDLRTLAARLGLGIRLRRGRGKLDGEAYPIFRGEIRFERSDRCRDDGEVVAIRPCRWPGKFWDVAIEDEPHVFALASGVLTHNSNPWPRNTDRSFTQTDEVALWAVKKKRRGSKWVFNQQPGRSYEDGIFRYPVVSTKKGKKRHPAAKPPAMYAEIMRILSNEGDLVVDPFAGGCPTASAAQLTKRRFICIEDDPQWAPTAPCSIATV